MSLENEYVDSSAGQTQSAECADSAQQSTSLGSVDYSPCRHSCTLCESVFGSTEALRIHMSSSHTSPPPPSPPVPRRMYDCPMCNRQFTQSCNMKTHMRVHTGERPFTCLQCGRTFSNKVNLRTHSRTHTGEKPFVCDTCHKCFTQVSYCYPLFFA